MELKRGFSLVELVVVIGLVSLLALALSAIMLTTIASSRRIRLSTATKQAGNYALNQIQTMVRNSRAVVACDSAGSTLTLVNPDGGSTAIFYDDSVSRIASNSGIYLTSDDIAVQNFSLTCQPDDIAPSLVVIKFDAESATTTSSVGNPSLHFESSIQFRNTF